MTEAQKFGIHAANLCTLAGIDQRLIRSITLEPRTATIVVYEVNEAGKKFINDDGEVAVRSIVRPLEFPA